MDKVVQKLANQQIYTTKAVDVSKDGGTKIINYQLLIIN